MQSQAVVEEGVVEAQREDGRLPQAHHLEEQTTPLVSMRAQLMQVRQLQDSILPVAAQDNMGQVKERPLTHRPIPLATALNFLVVVTAVGVVEAAATMVVVRATATTETTMILAQEEQVVHILIC
jgi:hypothetical protein